MAIRILSAPLAAALAAPLLAAQPAAAQADRAPFWGEGAQIEAIGRARMEVPPNRGSFGASYSERAETSAAAAAAATERANAVIAQLRQIGGDQVRVSANVRISPYYEQVDQTQRDGSTQLVENRHPDALLGYVAEVSLDVTVLEPELLAALRAAALEAGPQSSRQPNYFRVSTVQDQQAAFAAAVQDARQRAEIGAEGSNRRLGSLLFLTEGVDDCVGRPTSGTGSAPPPPPPAPPPPPPPPAGGQAEPLAADLQPQTIQATVCAVYSLQ